MYYGSYDAMGKGGVNGGNNGSGVNSTMMVDSGGMDGGNNASGVNSAMVVGCGGIWIVCASAVEKGGVSIGIGFSISLSLVDNMESSTRVCNIGWGTGGEVTRY
jgi:hypothetical protein